MRRIGLSVLGSGIDCTFRAVVVRSVFAAVAVIGVSWLALDEACAESVGGDGSSIRVMTLNLAHGRAMARSQVGIARDKIEENLQRAAQVMREVGPGLVAVQEADAPSTWSGGFSHLDYVAERAMLPAVCHGRHFELRLFPVMIQYGAALLSGEPLMDCRSIRFSRDRWDTKGFVRATVLVDNRIVTVVSVHLDYRSAKRRMAQARMMVDELRRAGGPLIVLGDFNTDGRKADSVRYVCDTLNLSRYEPDSTDPSMATYPADEPVERIDWILISDAFRFVGHHVGDSVVSDHRAVWADIVWR